MYETFAQAGRTSIRVTASASERGEQQPPGRPMPQRRSPPAFSQRRHAFDLVGHDRRHRTIEAARPHERFHKLAAAARAGLRIEERAGELLDMLRQGVGNLTGPPFAASR